MGRTSRLRAVLAAAIVLAGCVLGGCGSRGATSLLILDPIDITAGGAQLVAQLSEGGRVTQTTFLVKEAKGFTFCPEVSKVAVVDSAYTAEGWTSLVAARNTEADGTTFTYADASGLQPATSYAVCVITTVRDRPALGVDQQGAVGYAVIFETAGAPSPTSTPSRPTPEASPPPSPTATETPKSSPTSAPRTPTATPRTPAPLPPTPVPTPEPTVEPTPAPPPPTATPTPLSTPAPTAIATPTPPAVPTTPPTPRPTPTPEPLEDESPG